MNNKHVLSLHLETIKICFKKVTAIPLISFIPRKIYSMQLPSIRLVVSHTNAQWLSKRNVAKMGWLTHLQLDVFLMHRYPVV